MMTLTPASLMEDNALQEWSLFSRLPPTKTPQRPSCKFASKHGSSSHKFPMIVF
jgi:hypothetical protein